MKTKLFSPPPSPPKGQRRRRPGAPAAVASIDELEAAAAAAAAEAAEVAAEKEKIAAAEAAAAAQVAIPPSWLPRKPSEFDYGSMYASLEKIVGARDALSERYSELSRIVDDPTNMNTDGAAPGAVGALPPPVTQSARTRAKQALWGDSPLSLVASTAQPRKGRWAERDLAVAPVVARAAVPAVRSSVSDALDAPAAPHGVENREMQPRPRARAAAPKQQRRRAAKGKPSGCWSGSTRVAPTFGDAAKAPAAAQRGGRRAAAREQLEAKIGLTTSQVAAIVAQIKVAEAAAAATTKASEASDGVPATARKSKAPKASSSKSGGADDASWAKGEEEMQRRAGERKDQSAAQQRRRQKLLKQKLLRKQQQQKLLGGGAPLSLYDKDGRRVRPAQRGAAVAARSRGVRRAPSKPASQRNGAARRGAARHVTVGHPSSRREFIARPAPHAAPPQAPSRRAPPQAAFGFGTDAIKFKTPPSSPEEEQPAPRSRPGSARKEVGSIRRGTYWGSYEGDGSMDPPVLIGGFEHARTPEKKRAKATKKTVAPGEWILCTADMLSCASCSHF